MSFFIKVSGASTEYLEQCPETEHNKYRNIGITTFFTALLSSLAIFYATFTTFLARNVNIFETISNNFESIIYSLIISLIWGSLILSIDRYIHTYLHNSFK